MRSTRLRSRSGQLPGIAAALAMGGLALGADYLWGRFKRTGARHPEALSDGAAHFATGLAVALPAAPFVREPGRFLMIAGLSSILIDLDHVAAARSLRLVPCMTMPQRPPTHSVLAVGALTYLIERLQPGRQTELAVTLGLGSHLLRDLITGGAPLFMPGRIVEVARHHGLLMTVGLAALGRWYARKILDPARPRRSNPAVLAPEALVVRARAMRAARQARRAA